MCVRVHVCARVRLRADERQGGGFRGDFRQGQQGQPAQPGGFRADDRQGGFRSDDRQGGFRSEERQGGFRGGDDRRGGPAPWEKRPSTGFGARPAPRGDFEGQGAPRSGGARPGNGGKVFVPRDVKKRAYKPAT
jgi:hypothetical protein